MAKFAFALKRALLHPQRDLGSNLSIWERTIFRLAYLLESSIPITLLVSQGMRPVVLAPATVGSVRNAPGLFCQGCAPVSPVVYQLVLVPPPWSSGINGLAGIFGLGL